MVFYHNRKLNDTLLNTDTFFSHNTALVWELYPAQEIIMGKALKDRQLTKEYE